MAKKIKFGQNLGSRLWYGFIYLPVPHHPPCCCVVHQGILGTSKIQKYKKISKPINENRPQWATLVSVLFMFLDKNLEV